jgi:hypothetical protein
MINAPRLFLYLPVIPADRVVVWPQCSITVELGDVRGIYGMVADVLDDTDTSPANEQIRELVQSVLARQRMPLQPALLVRCRFRRSPQVDRLPAPVAVHLAGDPEAHGAKLRDLGLHPADYPGRRLPLQVLAINRRVARDDGPDEYTLLCIQRRGRCESAGGTLPSTADEQQVAPQADGTGPGGTSTHTAVP